MGLPFWFYSVISLIFMAVSTFIPAVAQDIDQSNMGVDQQSSTVANVSNEEIVTYSSNFFQRYQVNTALEMVNRVPGFTLDNGGNRRGFGTSVGNILINDRRPSTKQDTPSAILARISANLVERIELIRVKVRECAG